MERECERKRERERKEKYWMRASENATVIVTPEWLRQLVSTVVERNATRYVSPCPVASKNRSQLLAPRRRWRRRRRRRGRSRRRR